MLREKIRIIECNAKCRYLKKLPVKWLCSRCFICLRPPLPLGFCLGWCSNFVGSEPGQKQSVKLLQNMVSYTIQHPHTPSQPHTVCIYCTLTLRRGDRGGVRGAIVHKAGSKITTLTVSPVYKLYWTMFNEHPVKTTFGLVSLKLISPWLEPEQLQRMWLVREGKRVLSRYFSRRLLRSSQPRQIFQPRQEGFYSVQGLSSPVAASRKDFSAILTVQSLRHLPR